MFNGINKINKKPPCEVEKVLVGMKLSNDELQGLTNFKDSLTAKVFEKVFASQKELMTEAIVKATSENNMVKFFGDAAELRGRVKQGNQLLAISEIAEKLLKLSIKN